MNLENYSNFYKIDPNSNNLIETNLIYTPKISSDNKTMCMSFDFYDPYLYNRNFDNPNRKFYNKELVNYFFNRELKYFQKFQGKFYTPKIVDIDEDTQRIFFEWGGKSCNHIIYSAESLTDYCIDWKDQLYNILKDIKESGFCKASLYPHCFYIRDRQLFTIDYYGCAEINDPYVKLDDIRGMMGVSSIERFNRATEGNYLNLFKFSLDALQTYVKWPDDALLEIYNKLYR
jgi:hypothetical protein